MRNNYHYNQGNKRKETNFKKTTGRNNTNNANNKNNNFTFNKAQEENRRLKMELNHKTNILNDYNSRIEILREQLHQLQTQKNPKNNNYIKQNKISNNNRITNRGKSNNTVRVPNNNFNNLDPFEDIFNSGLGHLLFDELIPYRNVQRINPNFNPGDYEDYYQDNNINHIIGGIRTNRFNNADNYNNGEESRIEQDIIDQLYPDPDKMTYEQLLELEENVGSVSKGLTKKQIKKIPKVIYNRNKFSNNDNKCVVCQYEFKNGEEVTKLSCGHLFHSECVDTWLSKNKVCPMCHKEIIIK